MRRDTRGRMGIHLEAVGGTIHPSLARAMLRAELKQSKNKLTSGRSHLEAPVLQYTSFADAVDASRSVREEGGSFGGCGGMQFINH